MVVGRRKISSKRPKSTEAGCNLNGSDDLDSKQQNGSSKTSFSAISHSRSRSEPAIQSSDLEAGLNNGLDSDEDEFSSDDTEDEVRPQNGQVTIPMHRQLPQPQVEVVKVEATPSKKRGHAHIPIDNDHVPEGDDYLAIYETLDRGQKLQSYKNKSHSMEDLETPTPSLKSFDLESEATENGGRFSRSV